MTLGYESTPRAALRPLIGAVSLLALVLGAASGIGNGYILVDVMTGSDSFASLFHGARYGLQTLMGASLMVLGGLVLLRSRLAWHAAIALALTATLSPLLDLSVLMERVYDARKTPFSLYNYLTLFTLPIIGRLAELLIAVAAVLLLTRPPVRRVIESAAATSARVRE